MQESIIGRAQKSGKIQINIVNIRDYTEDKHLKCDDYPFGGGAGMVMMAQPIGSAIEALDPEHKARRIYMSPKGQVFKQQKVFKLLAAEKKLFISPRVGVFVHKKTLENIYPSEIVISSNELYNLLQYFGIGRRKINLQNRHRTFHSILFLTSKINPFFSY